MSQEVVFGRWLKRRRTALDLTQWDLAERIGCSRDAIQKFEAGARRPSKQIAELLIACLDIPPEQRAAFVRWARLGLEAAPPDLELASTPPPSASAAPVEPVDSAPPSNLPAPLTSLIGREEEVEAVRRDLLRDEVRLLTLTGPPGIGKTRLSIAVAACLSPHFQDGVYFLALEAVTDANLVIPAIGQVLGLKQVGDQPLAEGLVQRLHAKQLLLVLDNFEQVLDAGPQVLQLLSACPGLKALVTSREPLHAYGEWRFRVPPLELPDRKHRPGPHVLAGLASVALFTQRAQARQPDWTLTPANAGTVAALCLHLDGLPLAIELAAAQIEDLAPEQILAGLGDRLQLLRGDLRYLPPRQQTLRGAIDWSYHLLTGGERTLLRSLGVFVGGCSLAAVQAVCNANQDLPFEAQEGVSALVTKSLLYREAGVDGEPRWGMLESIREYAREQLEVSGEAEVIHRAHAEYYAELAGAANRELTGPQQRQWLERLEQDHDNIRAALTWSICPGHYATELALRIGSALSRFWEMHGHVTEGRRWLEAALELTAAGVERDGPQEAGDGGGAVLTSLRIQALVARGGLAAVQGDYLDARASHSEALRLCREAGDKTFLRRCLVSLATDVTGMGEYEEGRALYEQALGLLREAGDKAGIALTLGHLGVGAMVRGDFESARTFLLEYIAIRRETGDKYGLAMGLANLGEIAIDQADCEQARSLLAESLSMQREIGNERGIAFCLILQAKLACVADEGEEGLALSKEALALSRKLGDVWDIGSALLWRAELRASRGELEQAVRVGSAAEMVYNRAKSAIPASDRSRHERTFARARAELGEESFRRLWEEGQMMSLDQAIEVALSDPDA